MACTKVPFIHQPTVTTTQPTDTELRRTDLVSDDRYYTTAEVAEKYGMSTANVGVIVKARNLTKVKVGVRNLLLKEEIDGVMAERMAQYGSYIIA